MRIALNAQKLSFAQAYHSGGISRYTYHLLVELRALDTAHQINAFVPARPDDAALADTPRFRLTVSGSAVDQPIRRIGWEQVVLPWLTVGRYDLLHGLAFALPLAWPGRAVVTVLDLSFLRFPRLFNRANRLYLSLATRLAVRRASRVLTISEHGRQEVIRLLGADPRRVITTYCAADVRFRPLPAAEVEAFRQAKGLPRRFVLYLGTLEPRKNVATLVRAYADLARRWPVAPPLVLAGARGWLVDEVDAAIAQAQLGDRLQQVGFVSGDELPLWYNAAAVFAYPSLYEGFGLPPLEALACGTPVVASNASSLPEVVGEAGLLVAPFDERALGDSLRRALEDQQLRDHVREAGPQRASQFSWRRMATETVGCYDELASESWCSQR